MLLFLCVRVQSLQSCLTLCDPMDCSPPGSSVHEILQATILEWVADALQGNRPTQGSNPHWQVGSLPLAPHGKPMEWMYEWEDIKILTPGYLVPLPLQMKKSSTFPYKEETEKQLLHLDNASCFWSTELKCDLFKWKLWGNCFGGIHKTNVIFTWRIHPIF